MTNQERLEILQNEKFIISNFIKINDGIYYCEEDKTRFLRAGYVAFSGAVIIGNDEVGYYNTILHDYLFNSLPDRVKEFLLQHEVGHIKAGHLTIKQPKDIRTSQIETLKKIFIGSSMEYEADEYACNALGSQWVIEALRYLANLKLKISKLEIRRRILVIKIREFKKKIKPHH